MGFIDKLKNVFFEEIEEEEEEKPAVKLAQKIELPKKKAVVMPKEEIKQEIPKMEEEVKPKIVEQVQVEEEQIPVNNEQVNKKIPMMFEEEDFFVEKRVEPKPQTREERSEKRELYQGKREMSYVESVNKTPSYTYSKTYYENKETKGFKPSPIISPIYGILDKNYKKEEVITKKEIRVTSSNYGKVDLDSVRNKAFGSEEEKEEIKKPEVAPREELPKKEEKSFYDVNTSKPSVDKVTLADADEYYNDLGLAYNVDYKDTSHNNTTTAQQTRTKRYHSVEEVTKEKDDDNLFDLIESMYNKED